VVQFGDEAVTAVQVCTGTLVVLLLLQEVAVQLLPDDAAELVQLATGVGPTTTGPGQVVVVQEFAAVASSATHDCVGTFVWVVVKQVVAMKLFAGLADSATQDEVGVGPVVALEHVTVV